MTINDYHLFGYAASAAKVSGQQLMTRMGRASPIPYETQSVSPIIRPVALSSMPTSSDRWGVSFGGGVVAVTDRYGTYYSNGGFPFPTFIREPGTDYVSFGNSWWSDYTNLGSYSFKVVPSVLPSGYTARNSVDWFLAAQAYGAAITSYGGKWLNPTGFSSNSVSAAWVPQDPTGSAFSGSTNTMTPFGGGRKFSSGYGGGPGYRKVQAQLSYLSQLLVPPPLSWTGTISVSTSHNADGSSPPVSGGDTPDGATTFAFSDFTGGGANTTYTSSWKDLGSSLGTFGKNTAFQVIMDINSAVSGGFAAQFGVVLSLRMSPRVDIPFPFTVMGPGALIAPGGTC